MKGFELLLRFGEIDSQLVADAEPYTAPAQVIPRRAIAACLALLILAGIAVFCFTRILPAPDAPDAALEATPPETSEQSVPAESEASLPEYDPVEQIKRASLVVIATVVSESEPFGIQRAGGTTVF